MKRVKVLLDRKIIAWATSLIVSGRWKAQIVFVDEVSNVGSAWNIQKTVVSMLELMFCLSGGNFERRGEFSWKKGKFHNIRFMLFIFPSAFSDR
jgi:hypothetical protein